MNSLHGQGILRKAERVVIEGWAPDETPEAIHVDGAPGFALGVQWHPECDLATPAGAAFFALLGAAVRGDRNYAA